MMHLTGASAHLGGEDVSKLQAATRLMDLRHPPSNRSEALGGERKDQYSIRINDQWHICFRWAVWLGTLRLMPIS